MLQALHWRGKSTTGDGGGLLPKLERLHLYDPETDIDQALLVGIIIESRFKPEASTSSELQMDASSTSNGSEHPTYSSLALVQTTKPFEYNANVLHRVKRLMTAGFKFRRSSNVAVLDFTGYSGKTVETQETRTVVIKRSVDTATSAEGDTALLKPRIWS
ncbi:hypothetical protein BT96DRAFT_999650 [Gymnopus androsaceus JB14]|uniref:Uncharacterized protein n=1 Tax=Gymnopus androsaceus JB14 TaxID=1447944 RepID=A0A6A4H513_9AGAR|nr:hypothetical protein BT96DRAFT_999650 [Gymnopus androsaceus JB14]